MLWVCTENLASRNRSQEQSYFYFSQGQFIGKDFDYRGDNASFGSGSSGVCPALSGIDEGDTVRVWTQSLGSYSYDTQSGGNTTVPKFNVLLAQVVRKG